MLSTAEIHDKLAELARCRARNDNAAIQALFAPGARYRLAANYHLVADLPVEAGDVAGVVADLVTTFRFHSIAVQEQIVEGNKGVTRWRIEVSVEGGAPIQTELCDIWTFDENGLVSDLVEFTDTIEMARLFREAKSLP